MKKGKAEERDAIVAAEQNAIIEETQKENANYEIKVKSFFDGNEYYMFIYETFRDVRLVGAPPSSIGKYGGDTDNWMWTRHTGDFSVLRIYAAKTTNPPTILPTMCLTTQTFLARFFRWCAGKDYAMIMGFQELPTATSLPTA
ncbi:MAG: S46 family peptidase [Sphingobacteriales bacterium]|nr:S46 family peptidase [Sphingobacteriales bacterium]